MARRAVAAFTDTFLALLIMYGAFRAAEWSAHCRDQGQCVILTPLILIFIIAGLALYFAVAVRACGKTAGQWLLGTGGTSANEDEFAP